ncbi:hypothetical protein ACN079_29935 [Pseudomonas sp. ABY48]|uniref:hypothetical protein n=1 Tax=Pseudomonas sp. ABY48 TaxID=3402865 RepID=UPI003B42C1CB
MIRGSAYSDNFIGGISADTFDGANGYDTLSYASSAQAVNLTVTGAAGTGVGGDAQGDAFSNIEVITGSAYDDVFTVNSGSVTFNGGAGNDVYIINGGSMGAGELAGGGDDEIRTSLANMGMSAEVERLTYTGTANFTGRGKSHSQILP